MADQTIRTVQPNLIQLKEQWSIYCIYLAYSEEKFNKVAKKFDNGLEISTGRLTNAN